MSNHMTVLWQIAERPVKRLFLAVSLFTLALASLVFITLTSTSLPLKAAEAGKLRAVEVHGIWRTHNGELVRFKPCGSQICGQLLSTKGGFQRDKNNPNPKLRNRMVKGLTIIRSRKKTGPAKWVGTVYSVKDGKVYRGSLKLTGKRRALLTGCDGAFCQSATWTKISKTRIANN
jgi:uncharacterized protein (DUF2147 family)